MKIVVEQAQRARRIVSSTTIFTTAKSFHDNLHGDLHDDGRGRLGFGTCRIERLDGTESAPGGTESAPGGEELS